MLVNTPQVSWVSDRTYISSVQPINDLVYSVASLSVTNEVPPSFALKERVSLVLFHQLFLPESLRAGSSYQCGDTEGTDG